MTDQKKYIHYIEMYRRAYTDLQKEKTIQKGTGFADKSEDRSGTIPLDEESCF